MTEPCPPSPIIVLVLWLRHGRQLSRDWIRDCLHYHGRVLTGGHRHWCAEFDDLPVDDTCWEYQNGCICH